MVQHLFKKSYLFGEKKIYVCVCVCVSIYQLCSLCMSSGKKVSGCYVKQGAVSNIMAQNPQRNTIYQGRTKF